MNAMIADFMHLSPVLFMLIWAALVLLASSIGGQKNTRLGLLTALGLVFAGLITASSWIAHPTAVKTIFGGMMIVDRFALFFDMLLIVIGTLTVISTDGYLDEHGFAEGEFYAMILLSITGMMMMIHAGDFVMVVIGLESMSLAIYSLVACWPGHRKSAEGGMKYFLMGAVASAFLLYGIALLYGVTGSTNLSAIAGGIGAHAGQPLIIIAMFFVLGAMAFKIAAVPFHMWTPDAYEGAPTPVAGFMAAAVKAAGFALLIRLLGVFGADLWTFGKGGWVNVMWTLSIITMIVGNVAAIRQTNIKRMLAYSSVSHAGYMLIGVVLIGLDPSQMDAVLFYLVAYGLTSVGSFAVVAWLGARYTERQELEDWEGLSKTHPGVALAMTLFMLSLGGLPPTAGFFGKFYLFKAALGQPQMLPLILVAIVNSVISMYYYLRPVVAMYFKEGKGELDPKPINSFGTYAMITITAILVLLVGIIPDQILDFATKAIFSF